MSGVYSKSKLFSKLYFIPTRELRQEINKIISKNRNLDMKEAKLKRCLHPKEVSLIYEFFGIEN